MIKLLIGGSPCTHWSIAQSKNRETAAEGVGWEFFRNYLIAKEKFKPDYFLYENNKSAAQAIKDQIAKELGVGVDPLARFTYINSALVSAQNRQRFYVTNFGDIQQPADRHILLRDILETGCEELPVNMISEKAQPVCMRYRRSEEAKKLRKQYEAGEIRHGYHELSELHPRTDGKSNTISTVLKDNPICEPVRIGTYPNNAKNQKCDSKQYCIYGVGGKSVTLCGNGGCMGAKTGIYAIPVMFDGEIPLMAMSCADGKTYPVYQVKDGIITISKKAYPIKLADGFYIIRTLTVLECCRLQTMPDDYCKSVSVTQAYRGLGNGWTAEVIIHLLNHALKGVPKNEEIIVLSMYDGIGTGRYCLNKMGFTNVNYHAYEIDKYPMTIANDNYPDIIQHGDAFAVRQDDWNLGCDGRV